MENVDTAVYFPFSHDLNLSTVVIDSLKQNFPCDVSLAFLIGSNAIQYFLAGKTTEINESAH